MNWGNSLLGLLDIDENVVIEGSVGVLKASVTVKQRMCIRIGRNRCVQSIKNQSIIVAVADNKRNNPSVV